MAPTPSTVRQLLLKSDGASPNGAPHHLPALFWPGLFSSLLASGSGSGGSQAVKERLSQKGWDPQWTFPMYKEAHFHSTTHELLSIIRGSATILLGGADDIANHLSSGSVSSSAGAGGEKSDEAGTWTTLDVSTGDVLLLPAGYSHRALQDRGGFTMIGSYPRNGKQWDMCYPDSKKVEEITQAIEQLIGTTARKGLGDAQSPSEDVELTGWKL